MAITTTDVYSPASTVVQAFKGGKIYVQGVVLDTDENVKIRFTFADDDGNALPGGEFERIFTAAELNAVNAGYQAAAAAFYDLCYAVAQDYLETENPTATFT